MKTLPSVAVYLSSSVIAVFGSKSGLFRPIEISSSETFKPVSAGKPCGFRRLSFLHLQETIMWHSGKMGSAIIE